ncbi:MAG: GAF domain-containing SpoIIE family protein phosphatase, partial [Phycisphaeraceae bacterium]|nr:GAF domain-containing SpoIIE family protein phosphatase [Phycisphaeraceae bacterium]
MGESRPRLSGDDRTSVRWVDTSDNERLPVLIRLGRTLSRCDDPDRMLARFTEAMRDAYGPRHALIVDVRGLEPGQFRIARDFNDDVTQPGLFSDSQAPADTPVLEGGLVGQITCSRKPRVAHHLNVEDDPALGNQLAAFHAVMAAPVFTENEPQYWVLHFCEEPEGFSSEELEQLILRANLISATVANVQTSRQLREANEHIAREVEQIARIQRTLLPSTLPDVPGAALARRYRTCADAGGDVYGLRPLAGPNGDADRWAIMIGDASGHGPAAAVVMAMLHGIVHAYPTLPDGPAEVLEHANLHLAEKRIEGSFVTAFMGFYDPSTRELVYARAGHPPPVVKPDPAGPDNQLERLDAVGNLPLGVLANTQYDEATVQLEPHQTLLLYTDGITEARNDAGEMFGEEGIDEALVDCDGEPDCVIAAIEQRLQRYETGA